jgi:PilX N-terminal
MNLRQRLRSEESGGVLIIGLLTLLVLTAIGSMATRSSVMENEIAINDRNATEAFYATERAVTQAENKLKEFRDIDHFFHDWGPGLHDLVLNPGLDDAPDDGTVSTELENNYGVVLGTGSSPDVIAQHYPDDEPPRYSVWVAEDRESLNLTGVNAHRFHLFTTAGHGSGFYKHRFPN